MHEALFWEKLKGDKVGCRLCPHRCRLNAGQHGLCRERMNRDGTMVSLIYGKVCSIALDPVEKKPLYHFYPGHKILSAGTLGCNFSCRFCQNWTLSHPEVSADKACRTISPSRLCELAVECVPDGNIGVAYTYNEPSVWYEFVYDTAKLVKDAGLKNVLVTNGFLNREPLSALLPFIDAVNVDIKSINPAFYKDYCQGMLKPVLNYCKLAKEYCLVEITNLMIPTLNDSDDDIKKLAAWVAKNLGKDTPLHFSAYRPEFKMDIPPTSPESLERARGIAVKKLSSVYIGNIITGNGADSFCPSCKKPLVKRMAFRSIESFIKEPSCPFCGKDINFRV